MKRFQFRLEPLLSYREHLLGQAQQEVARIRADVLACDERIALLEKDSDVTNQELDKEQLRELPHLHARQELSATPAAEYSTGRSVPSRISLEKTRRSSRPDRSAHDARRHPH